MARRFCPSPPVQMVFFLSFSVKSVRQPCFTHSLAVIFEVVASLLSSPKIFFFFFEVDPLVHVPPHYWPHSELHSPPPPFDARLPRRSFWFAPCCAGLVIACNCLFVAPPKPCPFFVSQSTLPRLVVIAPPFFLVCVVDTEVLDGVVIDLGPRPQVCATFFPFPFLSFSSETLPFTRWVALPT